jgi:heterodisulfide reductase subunit A-like polyferredoxin
MFAQNTRSAKPAKAGLDCDVLVVGSGPAGGAAALLLASYGVSVFCVTKYSALAGKLVGLFD